MKVKNKIVTTLLALTCIFSLTACGAEKEPSEMTQQRITMIEQEADTALEAIPMMAENATFLSYVDECNNVELAAIFSQSVGVQAEGKAVRNAITSFSSAKENVGAIKELGEKNSVVDGDTIIVKVPVTCENGAGEIELIFSNDIFGKMESCTFNVNQSMGELMTKAGLNTLIGMGTVFAVLILISGIISCFAVIPKIQESFKKKDNTPAPEKVADIAPVVEEEDYADDTELVAVIAAAIAAYEGTSTDGFVVRSIKRSKTSKWNRA